jgi:hypothetical protein
VGYRLGVSKHSRQRKTNRALAQLGIERRSLLLTAILSFLVLRLLQYLFAGQYPSTYPDSGTYRVEGGQWLDFSLVGSQARPAIVTTFFALLPNDSARVFTQWLIATLAWLVLIGGVTLLLKKLWVSLIATLGVWSIGLSYFALQWDGTILSESLSISTSVLGIGFLIWWWALKKSWLAFASVVALGLAALNRPNLWVTLVGLIAVLLVLAKTVGMSRVAKWSAVGLTVFFLALGLTQQRVNDANFAGEGGLDRIGWSYASMLSDESPLASQLIPSLIGSGIPNCMIPQKPFVSNDGPINIIVNLQNSCPKGVKWVNENFLSWYVGFLLSNPQRTVTALGDLVGPSSQALPYGLDSKIEPPQALKNLFTVQDPGSLWTLLVLSLTAAGVTLLSLKRMKTTFPLIGLVIMELAFIVSWASGVLLQVWDLHRTIVTNVVAFNILALLVIAAAIDSFSEKKTV